MSLSCCVGLTVAERKGKSNPHSLNKHPVHAIRHLYLNFYPNDTQGHLKAFQINFHAEINNISRDEHSPALSSLLVFRGLICADTKYSIYCTLKRDNNNDESFCKCDHSQGYTDAHWICRLVCSALKTCIHLFSTIFLPSAPDCYTTRRTCMDKCTLFYRA